MSIPVILASASPARLATLHSAGVHPIVVVSHVDEPARVARAQHEFGDLAPADVALLLARAKAEDVAARLVAEDLEEPASAGAESSPAQEDGALVLGCDSVLELDGEAHGKPADAAEAVTRWQQMRGRSGVLHSGHWLIDERAEGTGATLGAVASTTVHFADLDDEEIRDYVATGEPLQVAGAFTIDGLAGPYISSIEGDHHNVVGLSLPLLRELLAEIGLPWRSLRS
ncbi:Maf family protein [Dermacoccaceae bacterium W4C1]